MRTALYLHACLLLFASATACAVEEAGAGLVPGDPPRANAAIASRRASLELLAALWRSDAAAITAWHAERAEGIDSAPTARARIKARLTQDYAAEIALATLAALLRESARSAEGPTGLGDTAAELISAIDRFATAASEEKGNAFAEFESAHRRFAALALSGVGGQPALAIDSVLAIEDLQANLAPGVASVVYTAEPDGNLGATIFTHDGIRHLRLGALQQITVLVDEARAAIVNLDSLDALDQLSARIWRPVLERLPPRTGVVRIKPVGALHYVPFAALRDQDGVYAVERLELQVADRLSKLAGVAFFKSYARDFLDMFGLDPEALALLQNERALIVAAPDFQLGDVVENAGDTLTTRAVRVDQLRFTPLPGSQREGRALETLLGDEMGMRVRLLEGADASRQSVERALEDDPAVLHFATHGFALEGDGGEGRRGASLTTTGLALAGSNHDASGLLSAREILELPLDGVELTFLSACNTGIGSELAGERFASLQEAFRLAGVERVVSTIWSIDDQGAAAFAEHFFSGQTGERATGLVSGAIAQAQRAMLESETFVHPFYWAGYASFDALDDPQALFVQIASRELGRRVQLQGVMSLLPTVLLSFEDGEPMSLDVLNALSRRFMELLPPLYRPMMIGFELGDGRLARAFAGEDRLYPVTGTLHEALAEHLSALRAAGSASRDVELLELALAQLHLPVPAEVGRERKAEALPKASVAVARAGFERVLAASVARGFDNRGFATAAAQAAFALHDIGDADIASAALGAYASALRNAGMGTAGVVFTDARVSRNLPRQWLARCAGVSVGVKRCQRAEYVVLEFDVDADGETRDVIVVETSDRRFGQFVQRRLLHIASPVRMLPLDTQEAAPQTRKARYIVQIRPGA